MAATPSLIEQFSAGPAQLRFDVYGAPREHILDDLTFLNYRLADVEISSTVTLDKPDIIWIQDGPKSVSYGGGIVRFTGDWPAGPMQKMIVAVLALRMEDHGLHPWHASAVYYKGKTILIIGGESNHGKSMALIEVGVRGGIQLASETAVVNEDGVVVKGSVEPFLIKRTEGTERADKAAPLRPVEIFWGEMPKWEIDPTPRNVDVVLVPAIDGNFDPSIGEMIPFERQFQSLHSIQNYFLTNELLAPGHTMPMLDNDVLRQRRAAWLEKFCVRPYYFSRGSTPQVLIDQLEKVL
ncbi:MAG: hypothetical protein LBR58_09900 [Propionibacteriaceae bacterium]|jgi:hypothetical protein|nr:hypothetical protein [Propionibacteriaceae bacterium]